MKSGTCRRLWLGGTLALLLAACGPSANGAPNLDVYVVAEGGRTRVEGALELPPTWLGRSSQLALEAENTGPAPLRLVAARWEPADPPPPFSLDLALPATLAPATHAAATVRFTPPYAEGPAQEFAATLVLAFDGAAPARFAVHGAAQPQDCSLPDALDFGGVTVGTTQTQTLALTNATGETTTAQVEAVRATTGPGSFDPTEPTARQLRAGATAQVPLHFTPSAPGEVRARLTVRRAEGCPPRQLALLGTGVDSCLSARGSPTTDAAGESLDFGLVAPGQTATGRIVVANACAQAVQLSRLRVEPAGFSLATGLAETVSVPAWSGRAPSGAVTPGVVELAVSYAPTAVEVRSAAFLADTSLTTQPLLSFALTGSGGLGPTLDASPTAVGFGDVPLATAGQETAVLALRLRNVGSTAPGGSPPLRFGSASTPAVSISAGANSTLAELCVGDRATCQGDVDGSPLGARELLTNEWVDLPLRLLPRTLGAKAWTLHFTSNDSSRPALDVDVRANVTVTSPCTYDVPGTIDFGDVAPPKRRELGVPIRNTGRTPCTFAGFHAFGTIAPYLQLRVQADAGQPVLLGPGELTHVLLELTPPDWASSGALGGSLEFNASSTDRAHASVALTARGATTCLAVTSDDVDFGEVPLGCASPPRTFRIYNRCANATGVAGVSFSVNPTSGDGGTPFELAAVGGLPATLPTGGAVSFAVRYRPPGPGRHLGTLTVSGGDPTNRARTVVLLRGTGSAAGEQEDTFVQPRAHRADVLLLVDSSASFGSFQVSLDPQWPALLRYARTQEVDLHLGVTTLDDDVGGERGGLRALPGGATFLDRTTQQLEETLRQLVQVGTNGSSTETALAPALSAVTAPLTGRPHANAGFLRDDATLGLVVLTDEFDQAPLPNAYYVDQLLNVKGPRRANAFSYSALGPFVATPRCPWGGGQLDEAPTGRTTLAISAMHGLREDLCEAAFSTAPGGALERLGALAFGRRERVLLTSRPAPGVTPAVWLDGQPFPGGHSAWAYDPIENAVVFAPPSVPGPGKTVRVRYATGCFD